MPSALLQIRSRTTSATARYISRCCAQNANTMDAEVPRSSTNSDPALLAGIIGIVSGFSLAQKLPVAMPLLTNTPPLVRVVPAVERLPLVAVAACEPPSVGALDIAVPPVEAVPHLPQR